MEETPKTLPETVREEERKKEEAVPPTMSGKLPSPFTEMRQKSDASSRTEQRNTDIENTRQEFHALVNRAVNRSAIRFASVKRQAIIS